MDKTILILLGLLAAAGAAVVLFLSGPPSPATPGGPTVRTSATQPSVDGTIKVGEYTSKIADLAGVEVSWAADKDTLRIGLVSPGTGYVAVGLDPQSMMDKANILLGAVVNGAIVARDDVGTGLFSHAADTSVGGRDNILAAAGREVEGKTIMEFAIPLSSGDSADRPLMLGQTYRIIVAYHATSDDFSERHSRRASGEIALGVPQ
jgi:hypothetical protein